MALTGPRIRGNNAFGVTTDNPLTIGATTLNSAQLAILPAVASAHAILTLDPLRQFGEPEIIVVTAHGVGATSATITRAAYGTAARSHPVGTLWVHAPVTEDVTSIVTSSTRPTDPYRGQRIFETDTNRYVGRSTADAWQQDGLFFDPPACRVYHSANQSFTNNVEATVAFNSERFDTDSMHDTVTNNSRITFNTAGLYAVGFIWIFESVADYNWTYANIRLNGTTSIGTAQSHDLDTSLSPGNTTMTIYKFAAGDYVEVRAAQNNAAAAARNLLAFGNITPEFFACWIGRGN